MAPNQVEPTARGMMGAIKRFWNRTNPVNSTTGSAGAYVLMLANTAFPIAYAQGERYAFKANFTSGGGDTLAVNSLPALPLYKQTSSGLVAIAASDIQQNQFVEATYDSVLNSGGGGFQIPPPASPAAVSPFWAGFLAPSGTSTVPAGWLYCDGSAVSRATYAALFAAISTAYGTGDGSTTFNLPDGRGRTLAGFDASNATGRLTASTSQGVSAAAIGNTGGEQEHTLITGELAMHTHAPTDPGHTHAHTDPGHAHTPTDPGHVHSMNFGPAVAYSAGGIGTGAFPPNGPSNTGSATSGITIQSNTTGITNQSNTTGITIANAGSGSAHNNVQPTLVIGGWMIKT